MLHTTSGNSGSGNLRTEPSYDEVGGTAVTQWKIVDDSGNVWFIGSKQECDNIMCNQPHNKLQIK